MRYEHLDTLLENGNQNLNNQRDLDLLMEDEREFINEVDIESLRSISPLIAALAAMGIVLGPLFMRLRKRKKEHKEKCKGTANEKACMKKVAIEAVQAEKKALLASASQCNKFEGEKKAKCQRTIKNLAAEYDTRIRKLSKGD